MIRNGFSPKEMSTLVSVVEQGYKLARGAIRHVSFLDWDLGELHEGYLRPLAINYLLRKEINQGTLPFTVSIETNRNKSHKFPLYSKGQFKMTTSQVMLRNAIARPAFFRDKLQQANQISMNLFGEDQKPFEDRNYYLLLTYSSGGKKPNFINLGMPNETHWIDKINLLKEPHIVYDKKETVADEEVITPENFFALRQFAEEVEGLGN